MSDGRYLVAVIIGCIAAALARNRTVRLQTAFLFADALGLGCYAVVGVEHALNAQLPALTAIMIGVITACGGGVLRDVLVRDEPLVFKPGQLLRARRLDWGQPLRFALPLLATFGRHGSLNCDRLLLCLPHAGNCLQLENSFISSEDPALQAPMSSIRYVGAPFASGRSALETFRAQRQLRGKASASVPIAY